MGAIFVSYRREDSEGQARALYNELAHQIGKTSVFMDVDSLALGRDFRQILQERLGSCDLMLALIGPDWLDVKDASGRRRLDSATDFVRQEIAAALKRNIPVTPVLIRGAQMPAPEQLPDDLKDLAYRHGFEVSHTRWDSDVRELIERLGLGKAAVQESQQPAIAAPRARHPVVDDNGAVVAARTRSTMTIAMIAGVTLLVLVSVAAWLMSRGNSQSPDPSTTLPPSVQTTPAAQSPAATTPVTGEPPVSPPKIAPNRPSPSAPPTTTTPDPVRPASPRPESTIRSFVSKEGGTPGTQRSPQLDHQETFETTGALKMEFALSPGACSKARLHILVDGTLVRQTEFFDDTTGLLDLGPVSPGRHTLTLSPEGQSGGCNSGTLGSWGGTLTLRVGS